MEYHPLGAKTPMTLLKTLAKRFELISLPMTLNTAIAYTLRVGLPLTPMNKKANEKL